jgi:hypothetical protein
MNDNKDLQIITPGDTMLFNIQNISTTTLTLNDPTATTKTWTIFERAE